MNILKALLDILPKQKKFYGQIDSILGDKITLELMDGGVIQIRSEQYASQFEQSQYVWITQDNNVWRLDSAPQFASTGTVEV